MKIKAFEEYCIPRKNIIAESFKFHQLKQKTEESFEHFYTEVKHKPNYASLEIKKTE